GSALDRGRAAVARRATRLVAGRAADRIQPVRRPPVQRLDLRPLDSQAETRPRTDARGVRAGRHAPARVRQREGPEGVRRGSLRHRPVRQAPPVAAGRLSVLGRLAVPPVTSREMAALDVFSAETRGWFEGAFAGPTPAQELGWPAIARGGDTLIQAP